MKENVQMQLVIFVSCGLLQNPWLNLTQCSTEQWNRLLNKKKTTQKLATTFKSKIQKTVYTNTKINHALPAKSANKLTLCH